MTAFKPKPTPAAPEAPIRSGRITTLPTLENKGRGGAAKVVQVNVRMSEEMAMTFSKLCEEIGSSRMVVAHLLMQAGYEVPLADQKTQISERRYAAAVKASQKMAERRKRA